MNKRANTILFILGATIFNVITTVTSAVLLLLLYSQFIAKLMPKTEGGHTWGFIIILVLALVISFVIYRAAINYLMKKIDVEKYFDPLYIKRFKKPSNS